MMIRRLSALLIATLLLAAASRAQQATPMSVIVKFRDAGSLRSPSAAFTSLCARVSTKTLESAGRIFPTRTNSNLLNTRETYGLDRVVVLPLRSGISATEAALAFAQVKEVEYSEPNHIYHIDRVQPPNDSLYSAQWAHSAMDVLGAWKVTKGDSLVRVGFVDTGVQWDHPDLVGQFAVNPAEDINHNGLFDPWPSTEQHLDAHGHLVYGDLDGIDEDGNGYVDDVIGYDFVDQESVNFGDASVRDPIPFDEESHAHGTAVAGVIAAAANNKIGVAGIAPGCRLVALRALDALGNGEADDIATAIVYAADNGVRILNLSFGDYFPSLLMRDAIRYATSHGVLVVASSGNEGSDARHYPSDFSDCLSVGMTAIDNTGTEVLSSASSFGENMDLVAPGSSILTTGADGSYQYISGTSFSAPATAAVAALALSHDPRLSNTELRSILESTTDYIASHGYDHPHANGRINAHRAVLFVGSVSVKLQYPITDDELESDSAYVITGSAASALFKSYTLWVAPGLNPDRDPGITPDWQLIDSSNTQVLSGPLATWKPTGLPAGTYTLRLAVTTSDLRSVEERATIRIRDHQAFATVFVVDTMYQNEKRVLLVHGRADSLCRAALYYRPRNATNWSAKQSDIFGHWHAILLTTDEVRAGEPLDLTLVLKTNAGDSSTVSFSAGIPNEAISGSGFVVKPYALPSGYLLDTLLVSGSQRFAVQNIASSSSSFGTLGAFKFDSQQDRFILVDSLNLQALPRAIGNVSGSGPAQLLIQGSGGSTYIYRGNGSHPVFGDLVFADTTSPLPFFPTALVDVDADGTDELIGRQEFAVGSTYQERYEADKIDGGIRTLLGQLPDSTAPAPQYGSNTFSTPETKSADFLGDGHSDIVFLDDDADIIINRFDPSAPTKFRTFFTDLNEGYTEGRNFTVGDFDGDGRPDLALAYHTSYDYNNDLELDASYWTVKVLLNNGNGTFRTVYTDRFYNARSNSPYRSSLGSVKNVTGGVGDNLVLSLFPNFYLLQYDKSRASMTPIWQYPVANSPRGAIAYDFDGNGFLEFGFDTGDSIRFFERSADLVSRAPAPTGLEVIPRDSNRIDVRWAPLNGSSKYYILRASTDPITAYLVIDSTSSTEYSDTTVENLASYLYSVQASIATFPNPLSPPAPGLVGFAHPTPRFSVFVSSQESLTLKSTEPVSTRGLTGGEFSYDDSLSFSSAILGGDSSIILTPSHSPITDGVHALSVRSFAVRDGWNSPFDTARRLQWNQPHVVRLKQFYVTRWRFESGTAIRIEFSMRPDDNGLQQSNYSLSPFGRIVSIRRDPADDSALLITVYRTNSFTPIGAAYTLCVQNVTSDGIEIQSAGDCAGETPIGSSLSNLFVYPSPVHESDESMTFAGLTPQASIIIYTTGMRLLRRLESTDQTGGIQWDLRDETGRKLPSGVYLYRVSGKDAQGGDVVAGQSKFVIVRDE